MGSASNVGQRRPAGADLPGRPTALTARADRPRRPTAPTDRLSAAPTDRADPDRPNSWGPMGPRGEPMVPVFKN